MEIKLNTEAKGNRVNKFYLEALDKIACAAEDGYDLTEHVFPKDIFGEVRTKINEHMKVFNVNFVWQSIGDMASVAVGDGRLMRFKLLS